MTIETTFASRFKNFRRMLLALAAVTIVSGAAAAPARADEDDWQGRGYHQGDGRDGWRAHERQEAWREQQRHEWEEQQEAQALREQQWRQHEWLEDHPGYYMAPGYGPPVTYYEAPEPPVFTFAFH